MDILNYEMFLNAVKHGSISSAAQANGYTQSAVSYIFKTLEKNCGFQLVHRTRNGISLTKFGELLLPKMDAVVKADKELQYLIFQLNKSLSGTVSLGCTSSMFKIFFLPVINIFHEQYPNVNFIIVDGSTMDCDRRLTTGEIDIGIFPYQSNMKHHYIFIRDDPLLAVLPMENTQYANRMFPLEDFSKYPFITTSFNDEFHILEDCEARGIPLAHVIRTQDHFSALYSVEAGLGVTAIPELSMRTKQGLRLNTAGITPPISRRLCLFVRDVEELDPVARNFYDLCCTELPKISRSL